MKVRVLRSFYNAQLECSVRPPMELDIPDSIAVNLLNAQLVESLEPIIETATIEPRAEIKIKSKGRKKKING